MSAGDAPGGGTAWIFPGQGSQVVGMGRALYESNPDVRALYDLADSTLGYALSGVCFSGPADVLQQTNYAQPALLVTELAHLAALRSEHGGVLGDAQFVAGHSLGEYTALVAAGALDFPDALRLVAERGRLMHQAGLALDRPTGMYAVLGLDAEQLAAICEQAGVDLANINAPGQIVISGDIPALEQASSLAREQGARRIVPLQVSAAFHSRWMRPMSAEFAHTLARTPVRNPQVPVISNVTAGPVSSGQELLPLLEQQTYSPVRWTESVQRLTELGVKRFVEIGPGKVLSGLVKRIVPDAEIVASEDVLG